MRATTKLLALLLSLLFALPAFALESVYFYYTDPAGTPLAMTNADGAVVWQADCMPFGELRQETSYAVNDRKFVGKPKDPETGLYYFGARYMEARIGRFLSPDPAGAVDPRTGTPNGRLLRNPQMVNPYAYGLNNPYRYVDPDGETPWDIVDVIAFGYSLYTFANEPTWSNAANLALDTAGLLPVVPAFGTIKRVGEGLNRTDDAIDATRAAKNTVKQFSKEKQALVDMAKADKRKGITAADMDTYKQLNKELPDPFPANKLRGPEVHPARGAQAQQPHAHVGPVDYIPIRDASP